MSRLTSLTTHIVFSHAGIGATGGTGLLFINSAVGWHAAEISVDHDSDGTTCG